MLRLRTAWAKVLPCRRRRAGQEPRRTVAGRSGPYPAAKARDTLRPLRSSARGSGARLAWLAWLPVLLALPLYATAIGWGWGPEHLWSWDEARPSAIVAPPYAAGDSWPVRYPLLQRDLLRLLFGAVDPVARWFGAGDPVELDRIRFLAGRALTVLMALLTVRLAAVTANLGRPAFAPLAGWLAAFAWLAVLPQTYYAKTMNLDAPYLFWLALAIWAFASWRAEARPVFSTLFVGAAAAAVLTKDQAFAFFVLPVLVLGFDLVRGRGRASGERPGLATFLLPAVGALAFAALSYRLAGGGDLLRRHVEAVRAHPSTYAFTAPDLASVTDRNLLALRHVAWSFGWPLALVIAAGVALALLAAFRPSLREGSGPSAKRAGSGAALLWFPLSYFLFALLPLGYNYDRFLLPVCWTLVVVAAGPLADFWARLGGRRLRGAAGLVAAAAIGWGIWRCVALDAAMAGDRRYALEAATRGLARATLVRFAVRAPQGFDRLVLPAKGDLPPAVLSPYELVVIPRAELGDLRLARLARALAGGLCGFGRQNPELERPSPWLRWIDFKGVLSNLGEVDPPLVVFRRAAPPAPCAAADSGPGS